MGTALPPTVAVPTARTENVPPGDTKDMGVVAVDPPPSGPTAAPAPLVAKSSRRWRTWQLLVGVGVALLVGMGLGAAGAGSDKAKVEKQLAAAEGRASKAESQIRVLADEGWKQMVLMA